MDDTAPHASAQTALRDGSPQKQSSHLNVASTVGSSHYTGATLASSHGAAPHNEASGGVDAKQIELNGKVSSLTLFSARVTYADGFGKASKMATTAQAADAKNRTIGHYIVGRQLARFLTFD